MKYPKTFWSLLYGSVYTLVKDLVIPESIYYFYKDYTMHMLCLTICIPFSKKSK